MRRWGGFSAAPAGMYQSAGTSCLLAQSIRSVELLTVTVLFGGRIGGPPTTLIARPYRLKTIVPIALSRPDSGVAAAVEVISALAGAATATAAVSGAAVAFRAAAASLREVGSTVANGSTLATRSTLASRSTFVFADSENLADSVGVGSSDSGLAVGFAVGCRLTAGGVAGLSAAVSAVSESVFSASLTVSAVGSSPGCWAGDSLARVPSSCLAASESSASLGPAVASFFGFLPEGFGFGVPVPSLSESGLFSVEFADSEDVVPLASEPDGLSALATPAPVAIPAATPAVTVTAPNHSKNRSAMPPPS